MKKKNHDVSSNLHGFYAFILCLCFHYFHTMHSCILSLPVQKVKAHRAYKSFCARENTIQNHMCTRGLESTNQCETWWYFSDYFVKYYDLIFYKCNNISDQQWGSVVFLYAACDFECNSPAWQFSIQQDLVSQLFKIVTRHSINL